MLEIWKEVEEYEGYYEVSNLGRVRRVDSNNRLYNNGVLSIDTSSSYARVNLNKNGISKHYLVHVLVAKAFLSNPNHYPIINHKDENRLNNEVCNLEWCTYKYNSNFGNCCVKRVESSYINRIILIPIIAIKLNNILTFNSILECSTYFLVSSKIIEKCLTNDTPIQGFSLKFNNKKFMEVNNFMSSRMVVAAAKRVNKLTINLQNKKAKLEEKQRELEEDKLALEKMIEANEAGVKALTGGFTSEQVLNGEMELAMSQSVESPAEAPVEETVCGVSVSDLQAQDNALRAEEAPVNPFGLKLDESSPLPFEA